MRVGRMRLLLVLVLEVVMVWVLLLLLTHVPTKCLQQQYHN